MIKPGNEIRTETKTEKKVNKKTSQWIISFVIMVLFLLPATVLAEDVELRLNSSPEVAREDELVTVMITFEAEQNIGTIHAEFQYDEDLLEYQYGGGNVAQLRDGKGSISDSLSGGIKQRSYEFAFLAKKAGEAELTIEFSEVISYELGTFLGAPEAAFTVTIEEAWESEEDEDEDDSKDEDGQVLIDTKQKFHLFSLYQTIPGYEMHEILIDEHPIVVYGTEDLPEGVNLIFASPNEKNPRLYFYDEQENSLQRAWEEEQRIEKEVAVDSGVSSEVVESDNQGGLLPWPILLLIFTALILIITIVLLEQSIRKPKSNNQRGE